MQTQGLKMRYLIYSNIAGIISPQGLKGHKQMNRSINKQTTYAVCCLPEISTTLSDDAMGNFSFRMLAIRTSPSV